MCKVTKLRDTSFLFRDGTVFRPVMESFVQHRTDEEAPFSSDGIALLDTAQSWTALY